MCDQTHEIPCTSACKGRACKFARLTFRGFDAAFSPRSANANLRGSEQPICSDVSNETRAPMSASASAGSSRTSDWIGAFKQKNAAAFSEILADNAVLEASVLYRPLVGREKLKLAFETASRIYETLEFTNEVSDGLRHYVEWRARAFGGLEMSGVTIITRNEAGTVAHLAIHHRPLAAVLRFSAEMSHRLAGAIDRSHFLAASDLPLAKRK